VEKAILSTWLEVKSVLAIEVEQSQAIVAGVAGASIPDIRII
jgi:hypothetical protein